MTILDVIDVDDNHSATPNRRLSLDVVVQCLLFYDSANGFSVRIGMSQVIISRIVPSFMIDFDVGVLDRKIRHRHRQRQGHVNVLFTSIPSYRLVATKKRGYIIDLLKLWIMIAGNKVVHQ